MWDLPGPGIEPVSPALAGGFLTTAPPLLLETHNLGNSLAVQWLGLHAFTAEGPGGGTKILQAMWCGQKKKKEKERKKKNHIIFWSMHLFILLYKKIFLLKVFFSVPLVVLSTPRVILGFIVITSSVSTIFFSNCFHNFDHLHSHYYLKSFLYYLLCYAFYLYYLV